MKFHRRKPSGHRALDEACNRIVRAANGDQEATLNRETFRIGSLALRLLWCCMYPPEEAAADT
jgi:hypothetical protein